MASYMIRKLLPGELAVFKARCRSLGVRSDELVRDFIRCASTETIQDLCSRLMADSDAEVDRTVGLVEDRPGATEDRLSSCDASPRTGTE